MPDTAFLDSLHDDPARVRPELLPDESRASYERLLAAAREAAAEAHAEPDGALARVNDRLAITEPADGFAQIARRFWWVGAAALALFAIVASFGAGERPATPAVTMPLAEAPAVRSGPAIERAHDRAAARVALAAARDIAVLRKLPKSAIVVFAADFDHPQALLARYGIPHTVVGAAIPRLLAITGVGRAKPGGCRVGSVQDGVAVLPIGALAGVGEGARIADKAGAIVGEVVSVRVHGSTVRLRKPVVAGTEVFFATPGMSVRDHLKQARVVLAGSTRLPRLGQDWPLRPQDGAGIGDSSDLPLGPVARELDRWMKKGGFLVTTEHAYAITPGWNGHFGMNSVTAAGSYETTVAAKAAFARPSAKAGGGPARLWIERPNLLAIMKDARAELVVKGVGPVAQSYRRGRGMGLHLAVHLLQKDGNDAGHDLVHRLLIELLAATRRK